MVLAAADAEGVARPVLIASNPYAAYARMAAVLHAPPALPPGVHPTAWVDPLAQVADSAHVAAPVSIGAGARIARGARIGDDETVAAGLSITTDRKGLWLAA